ncbi:MAG: type II secretion system protein, partial [bacterium]|nr:type II secretion system protein [bacterium]
QNERFYMKAFTLAEVLITLAIIGVVAAVSIPSVISNSQQQEFKTGLRKAVSVLNSAITMNMALDGETPYDNANLFGFLMKHMSVMQSYTRLGTHYYVTTPDGNLPWTNAAFYTTDGMRFEFHAGCGGGGFRDKYKLYENSGVALSLNPMAGEYNLCPGMENSGCGSFGLNTNGNETTKPPCMIAVDVNGDRKPNPANVNCKDASCAKPYKFSDPGGKKLTDIFSIMITDKEAVPYGAAAQRAMYNSQRQIR